MKSAKTGALVLSLVGCLSGAGPALAGYISLHENNSVNCTANDGTTIGGASVKYTPPTYNSNWGDFRASCNVKATSPKTKYSISSDNGCTAYIPSLNQSVGNGKGNATRNAKGDVNFACQFTVEQYCGVDVNNPSCP